MPEHINCIGDKEDGQVGRHEQKPGDYLERKGLRLRKLPRYAVRAGIRTQQDTKMCDVIKTLTVRTGEGASSPKCI